MFLWIKMRWRRNYGLGRDSRTWYLIILCPKQCHILGVPNMDLVNETWLVHEVDQINEMISASFNHPRYMISLHDSRNIRVFNNFDNAFLTLHELTLSLWNSTPKMTIFPDFDVTSNDRSEACNTSKWVRNGLLDTPETV